MTHADLDALLEDTREGNAIASNITAAVGGIADCGQALVVVVDERVGAVQGGTLGQVVIQANRELLGIARSAAKVC